MFGRGPIVIAACLACALAAAGTPPARLDDAADAFAADLCARLDRFVCAALCIDPETGAELRDKRRTIRARQRQAKRDVERLDADDTSGQARQLRRRARTTLATDEVLALPHRQRAKLVAGWRLGLSQLRRRFGPALRATIAGGPPLTEAERQGFRRRLAARMAAAPALHALELPTGRRSTHALYIPATGAYVLHVDMLAKRNGPRLLLNALEHEIWHQLLPVIRPGEVGDNPWFEGFVECAAEALGAKLHADNDAWRCSADDVAYPVQTAFAALALGSAREATGAWLAGAISSRRYAELLADVRPAPLRDLLREHWAAPLAVSPGRQARVESLLDKWGWHDDGGAALRIGRNLHSAALDPAVLARDFRTKPDWYGALIAALALSHVQDLRRTTNDDDVLAALSLPPHLRETVRRVLVYAGDARLPYARHILYLDED